MDVTKLTPNYFDENQRRVRDPNAIPDQKKVTSGDVKVKKENYISSFANDYLKKTAAETKDKFIEDLFYKVKQTIYSFVSDSLHMFLFHDSKKSTSNSVYSNSSYMKYYKSNQQMQNNRSSALASAVNGYEEVYVSSRGEAEEVLSTMQDIIDVYGMVRVSDLYDLVGYESPNGHTSNNYGWTNITSGKPERNMDGMYRIKLPRPIALN